MLLEFQTPLPPFLLNSSPRNSPLTQNIPRCCTWYGGMDIFWNHPLDSANLDPMLSLLCIKERKGESAWDPGSVKAKWSIVG